MLVREKKKDGSDWGPAKACCERHQNAFTDDEQYWLTGYTAGSAPCHWCELEASQDDSLAVPDHVIAELLHRTVAKLSPQDRSLVQGSVQLSAMLLGFIHALVYCKVDQADIPQLAVKALVSCWTKPVENEKVKNDDH